MGNKRRSFSTKNQHDLSQDSESPGGLFPALKIRDYPTPFLIHPTSSTIKRKNCCWEVNLCKEFGSQVARFSDKNIYICSVTHVRVGCVARLYVVGSFVLGEVCGYILSSCIRVEILYYLSIKDGMRLFFNNSTITRWQSGFCLK
jgi:hypothetical protein